MIALISEEVKPLGVGALGKTCNNNFPTSGAALGNTACRVTSDVGVRADIA
jgi:hypothetical protein